MPHGPIPTTTRQRIQLANTHERTLSWTKGFLYIEPSRCWTNDDNNLHIGFNHTDHLIRPGDEVCASQMASGISQSLSNGTPGITAHHPGLYSPITILLHRHSHHHNHHHICTNHHHLHHAHLQRRPLTTTGEIALIILIRLSINPHIYVRPYFHLVNTSRHL